MSRASESRLTKKHYTDVLIIAKSDTILIIAGVITFLLLNLPITNSEEVPYAWYKSIYYGSLLIASLLGGGFIAVVTMLYGTISNIILIVGLMLPTIRWWIRKRWKRKKNRSEEAEKVR